MTLVEKDGGKVLPHQFECAPFFFFHTINAFERHNDTIVVDIMAYKNADVSTQYVEHNLNETSYTDGQREPYSSPFMV